MRQDHQEKLDALGREQAKTEQDLVDKYRDIVSSEPRYCSRVDTIIIMILIL